MIDVEFRPWALELFGEHIRSDEVTVGLAARIEEAEGWSWPRLRVAANVTSSTSIVRKVAAYLYADRSGMSFEDAQAKVDGLSAAELDAAVVLVDDDKPTAYQNGFPTKADEDLTAT